MDLWGRTQNAEMSDQGFIWKTVQTVDRDEAPQQAERATTESQPGRQYEGG